MAAGDVTVLGPYKYSEMSTMDTALTAKTAGSATESVFSICSPMQFWVVHVEGA